MIFCNTPTIDSNLEIIRPFPIRNRNNHWPVIACALLLIIFLAPKANAQNPVDITDGNPGENGEIFGAGVMSCGQWLSSNKTKQQGRDWILGWWTAAAYYSNKNNLAADKANEEKILADISKICRKKPEAALTDAITRTYLKLERRKPRR